MTEDKPKVKKGKKESDLIEIKPLRDFEFSFNEFHYNLKKGEITEVHKMFLPNLKTEKVIKE